MIHPKVPHEIGGGCHGKVMSFLRIFSPPLTFIVLPPNLLLLLMKMGDVRISNAKGGT